MNTKKYNSFRYYDPNTGCYISQDPIGLAGGPKLQIDGSDCYNQINRIIMDLYDKILNKGDVESIVELMKEDKKVVTLLYSYETMFSKTLNYLLVNRNKNADFDYLFTIFIDILIGRLINKPGDLLSCIQKIKSKNNQILFLKTVVHHRLVNDDFLISLGGINLYLNIYLTICRG